MTLNLFYSCDYANFYKTDNNPLEIMDMINSLNDLITKYNFKHTKKIINESYEIVNNKELNYEIYNYNSFTLIVFFGLYNSWTYEYGNKSIIFVLGNQKYTKELEYFNDRRIVDEIDYYRIDIDVRNYFVLLSTNIIDYCTGFHNYIFENQIIPRFYFLSFQYEFVKERVKILPLKYNIQYSKNIVKLLSLNNNDNNVRLFMNDIDELIKYNKNNDNNTYAYSALANAYNTNNRSKLVHKLLREFYNVYITCKTYTIDDSFKILKKMITIELELLDCQGIIECFNDSINETWNELFPVGFKIVNRYVPLFLIDYDINIFYSIIKNILHVKGIDSIIHYFDFHSRHYGTFIGNLCNKILRDFIIYDTNYSNESYSVSLKLELEKQYNKIHDLTENYTDIIVINDNIKPMFDNKETIIHKDLIRKLTKEKFSKLLEIVEEF